MNGANSALDIADAVRTRQTTVTAVVQSTLDRIGQHNTALNHFSEVLANRALARAAALDTRVDAGEDVGALAGVPFGVKNLVDIEGLPTIAGSIINRDRAPAQHDSILVKRLEAAGAVLVGALHMGEYAYDFTGRNAHYGPARNPHDTTRMTAGSSSGVAGAVAAGLVPLSIGSDTNGSIRVPAAFCGLFGLKPTYGRITRADSFPFVASLDHMGPFARSVADLAAMYDLMQGGDDRDPACVGSVDVVGDALTEGVDDLRLAVAGGYFARGARLEVTAAVASVAKALGSNDLVEIEGAERARAAAFLITAVEGANLHLGRLRERAADFDPEVRPRLIAGAMVPGSWYVEAQRYRRRFRAGVLSTFRDVDVIIAPTAPLSAPRLDQVTMELDGRDVSIRAHMGIYTQPLSFIGLPVLNVPVAVDGMPIGVQLIGAPWNERALFRVAAYLERLGAVRAPVASLG